MHVHTCTQVYIKVSALSWNFFYAYTTIFFFYWIVSFHKLSFANKLMTVQTLVSYLRDNLSLVTQILD